MVRLVVLVVLLVGCKTFNEQSCDLPDNQNKPQCNGGGDDGGPDTPQGCTRDDDCTGLTAPICNLQTMICEGCTAHSQCTDSDACLPTGACAEEAEVAYVAGGATGDCLLRTTPCGTLDTALITMRPTIKVAGGALVSDTKVTTINNRTVTIVADPTAKVSRSSAGSILEIKATSTVVIADLEFSGATGASEPAFSVPAGMSQVSLHRVKVVGNIPIGISVGQNLAFSMDRCIVSANINGGVSIQNIDFQLTNNLFVNNGAPAALTGGMELKPATLQHTFDFNTISNNVSSNAGTTGVSCINPTNGRNNIIGGLNTVNATCTFEFTLFPIGTTVGGTNMVGDPMFLSTSPANPSAPNYFRIGANSAAKNMADTAATLATDIDGDARPAGMADMGADEAPQ